MTIEILRKFVHWTKIKFRLHTAEGPKFYFREREIWWCSLGANIGHEQDGKKRGFERPVLVLKKFNPYLLWTIPLTSKQKQGKYYIETKYRGESYMLILSQLRVISSKRLTRKIRTMPKKEFDEVRQHIKDLI